MHSDGESGWGEGEVDTPVLTDPKSGVPDKQHKPTLSSSREPQVVKGIKEETEKGSSSQQAPCP